MPKGYWINTFRSVSDAEKLARYVELAALAMTASGGRFVARGTPAAAFEAGVMERTIIIEFDSVEQALATYTGPAYQAALQALDGGAVRDVRIIEGVS
jgi:uncharacterized protein (DUF1330 family)